jgi:hypothetical protein
MTSKITTIELNEAQIDKIRREAVRAVLDLFQEEPANFVYNEPNNYGLIKLTLWTGDGDAARFMGDETMASFHNGFRGTGCYKLNDTLVDLVLEKTRTKL